MADRSSAAIFGDVFTLLAKELDPGPKRDKLARHFWKESRNYDFNEYQMGCDEALFTLGLARKGVDPDYPEDGETTIYGPLPEQRSTGGEP